MCQDNELLSFCCRILSLDLVRMPVVVIIDQSCNAGKRNTASVSSVSNPNGDQKKTPHMQDPRSNAIPGAAAYPFSLPLFPPRPVCGRKAERRGGRRTTAAFSRAHGLSDRSAANRVVGNNVSIGRRIRLTCRGVLVELVAYTVLDGIIPVDWVYAVSGSDGVHIRVQQTKNHDLKVIGLV